MDFLKVFDDISQLHAINTAIKSHEILNIHGLGVGELAAVIASRNKMSALFCGDENTCLVFKDALSQLNKKADAITGTNEAFSNFKFASRESVFNIIEVLAKLVKNNIDFLSLNVDFLLYPLPKKHIFEKYLFNIRQGGNYDLETLAARFVSMGYSRVERVETYGEFSIKGDIVDIFAVGNENILRLDFFGDELEQMYFIDTLTLTKLEKLDKICILPATLIFYNEIDKKSVTDRALKFLKTLGKNDLRSYEILSDFLTHSELESSQTDPFLMAFFSGQKSNILEYLPEDCLNILFKEFLAEQEFASANLKLSKKIFENFNNADSAKELEKFFVPELKVLQLLKGKTVITDSINKRDVMLEVKTVQLANYLTQFDKLLEKLKSFIKSQRVIFCLKNVETLQSIKQILTEKLINFSLSVENDGLILTEYDFAHNVFFENEKTIIIGSNNFAYKKTVAKRKQTLQKFLPQKGDYVVHNVHGIGYCEGIVNLTTGGVQKDYFKLIYQNNAILYIPCENTDSISLYMTGGNAVVRLSKIGGSEFAAATKRAMQSIKEMARELILLYSARQHKKRKPYPDDDYLYTQFEAAFKFGETPDQLQAISDIANDMHSDKIMDRLICGDVGFGKTEVAFRAAFRAVLDGRQVAILAPTTVLSMQHFMSATERFNPFGINVEMLNRFKTKTEQKEIISRLKNGKINIICGTHRLLSKDVEFFDLGLLVLDEEQRFGVTAKEKIKQLKQTVDVLTLTATPIPRTLNMALLKIRDISILNTPPLNRISTKTYVIEYNLTLLADVISREFLRHGQVLIVCNNIDQLYTLSAALRKLLPENVNIDIAHGQMKEKILEEAVKRLYDGHTDVFISTTIIENGIDLPNANTMIVLDSHKLGLSQMYQLRGRVGRSGIQAYCYFTYPNSKSLTVEAGERLQAIAEHTELGSGIKLAMRDLQIRGAGELLGSQQHGHIVNIGYDMYIDLLEKATKELTGEKVIERREVKLDIAISANIPKDFILDEVERLKVYNLIFNISSVRSQKETLEKLKNLYGHLHANIVQLTNVALIKALAISKNIKHIVLNNRICKIEYYEDNFDVKELLKKIVKFSHFSIKNAKIPTIIMEIKDENLQNTQSKLLDWLINY